MRAPPPSIHPPPPTHIHMAAAQVPPPSQRIVAPRRPEGSSLWARDGQSRTSGVHLKEGVKKKKNPHFRVKKEISSPQKKKK